MILRAVPWEEDVCYIDAILLMISGDTFDEAVIAAEYGGILKA